MPRVTLSFDNGPDPATTPHVLKTLRKRRILATFFVIGRNLADPARRSLAEQARDEGHWIGNHSLTHGVPLGLLHEPGAAVAEIARAQEAIGPLAHPDLLFRPFGGGGKLDRGLLNREAVDYLTASGFSCVLWNCVPHDWDDPEGWVARALTECAIRPWTLVVLHDLPTGAMLHLGEFLDLLANTGAEVVQELPPQCVPIRRGAILLPIDDYVSG